MKRIQELEQLAGAYNGVEKAYAIQAGRELRVIVESEKEYKDWLMKQARFKKIALKE